MYSCNKLLFQNDIVAVFSAPSSEELPLSILVTMALHGRTEYTIKLSDGGLGRSLISDIESSVSLTHRIRVPDFRKLCFYLWAASVSFHSITQFLMRPLLYYHFAKFYDHFCVPYTYAANSLPCFPFQVLTRIQNTSCSYFICFYISSITQLWSHF